ncbi:MAG: selenocysteine-specific translation elongation factor [Actinobacteria bacterium]|nr:selenocysteine-specific translation elongation factor [Actinomycetota bacterium]
MDNVPRHLVLGTAGHIDHGKTALIKALTGTDTDRLAEEKERGISIELGYAELELPSGTTMSVIDVPGHERFVRNMVAGASGIDIFMLVVAADDGVMPQTREHMAIIEMLGIPQGIIAITKTDLVDEEMLELVQADIEDFLAATPYADAPMTGVSSKTGEGIPLLLGLLEEAAGRAHEAHEASGAARLPVDRVFTLKGIGTVVTGTLWSGRICAEDSLRLMPEGLPCRARTVQVHDRSVECAEAGQRVAINLSGIDKDRLERGQMVLKGEGLEPTYMVDARLTLLPTARALKYGAQVRFHHGTADATAKLMFADRDRLAPEETCYAQVRLKTKIVPVKGDRFIIRSLSPVTTIGGGVVIDPHPHKHGKGEGQVQRLEVLEKGVPADIVSLLLEEARPGGLPLEEIEATGLLSGESISTALADAAVAVSLVASGSEVFFAPQAVNDFGLRLEATLEARQQSDPADPALSAEEIAKSVDMDATDRPFQALLAGTVNSGLVTVKEQRYSMASAVARLSDAQQKMMEDIAARLEEAGMSPPSLGDIATAVGARTGDQDFKLVLKLLVEDERAVKVKPDLYYAPEPVEIAREAVLARCNDTGQITLAELRDMLDVSRKFAQALLEYFDRTGLTRREGDYRVLRKTGTSGGRTSGGHIT